MNGKGNNEFEGLERFKDDLLSRMGIYGGEERRAAEAAILLIKENWIKRKEG